MEHAEVADNSVAWTANVCESFKRIRDRLNELDVVVPALRSTRFRQRSCLQDSGRLAILRQRLPQQCLPFGMVEAKNAHGG